MRLVCFDDYRIGVLEDGRVRDVSAAVPGWQPGDRYGMNRLIAGWDDLRGRVDEAARKGTGVALEEVRLRAPVPAPMHLFAAPGNFGAHVQEMAAQGLARASGSGATPQNTAETLGFFIKATGSITGPSDPITIPVRDYPDRRFDHEGEIAFVIGRPARAVAENDFGDYVFGYTIVVDVTLRGTKEVAEERVQRKSFASFSPMGPCLVTADEVPDWRQLNVKLWLNGEQKQDATATDMIVSIPRMLSRASHVLPLDPGDVYTTGSPPGVGQIAPGDTVEVMSPQIGSMTLKVTARDW